jgi:signal transduction histidine kinase
MREAAEGVRRTVGQLRTLMIAIHPPNLEAAGLEVALTDLLDRLATRGIATHLADELSERLAPEKEALFFRIAQEAVRNVATHAGAGRVTVRAWRAEGRANLAIEDDGRGFSTAAVEGDPRMAISACA